MSFAVPTTTAIRLAFCTLCVAVLAGCHSANNNQHEAANIDTDSIAEAPIPKIEPQTFIAAGDLAASRQQYAQAAHQYGQALEGLPKDGPTMKKMGICQVKSGDLPAAIATFQRYVATTDGAADAYGSLGYAYELSKNPDQAEKTYQEGIKKHPDGKLVRINYGLMLVRHARVEDAITQLSAVLQPQEVNYDIAGVYDQMGRKDLAQFYYRKALECDPGFVPARQKLSMVDQN